MGVLMGCRSSKGKGQFWGEIGASHCNQLGLCGVVILCHEGWLCGSARVTLGFV